MSPTPRAAPTERGYLVDASAGNDGEAMASPAVRSGGAHVSPAEGAERRRENDERPVLDPDLAAEAFDELAGRGAEA
jgi:hypothetical protein